MKKLVTLLTVLVLALALSATAFAENGTVTYSGNAGEFIFAPGSDHSLSDLFPDLKDLMPGDSAMQTITVKNDADNKVKVEIYVRSLGAHEQSEDFLSQLTLKVMKSDENEMAYMFDAAASESAQLSDWVLIGTLYSGGEINLDVTIDVPVELGNEFQDAVGYLDWEFMVKELAIEPDDPRPPQTGDTSNIFIWIAVMGVSLLALFIVLILHKKEKNGEKEDR